MIWHHHNEEFPIFLDAIVSGSVIDSFNYCIFRELVYLHHIYHTLGSVLNKTLFVVFLSLWAMANDNVYLASRHRRAEKIQYDPYHGVGHAPIPHWPILSIIGIVLRVYGLRPIMMCIWHHRWGRRITIWPISWGRPCTNTSLPNFVHALVLSLQF